MFKNIRNLFEPIQQLLSLVRKGRRNTAKAFLLIAVALASGCNSDGPDDPDEGGIIGSGVIIRGTVNEAQFASTSVVEFKSSDGQLTSIPIDSSSQYSATYLAGAAPWVLRVTLGTNRTVYGIAFTDATRNINRFSDISLRQWFAQQPLDLDAEFKATGPFTDLPSASEYSEVVSSIFTLIGPVLDSYGATAEGVISGDYAVEELGIGVSNQGTNAFLQRNTVLLEENTFQFAITEPATRTQSLTLSTIRLGNNLRDGFSSAPTRPEGIRALGSANDEIVLVWNPSTDDVSVVGYRVVRNGALIATTPYPVFIDSGLAIQEYTYEIIAFDAAGNASEASASVIASPLQSGDTTPPLAPTVLIELDTSDSTIHLLWAQRDIEEVASYNVLRGSDMQSLELRFRVTSTDATDSSVIPGETYCYAVESVDASGNTSEPSDTLCVIAGDPNPNNGNEPLENWVIPDIESLDCDTLGDPILLGLTVLASGCFNIPDILPLAPGATLRIAAGVVVVFDSDAGLIVPSTATLTTNGTPENPVVLTGNVNVPGSWYGVEFQNSMSSGNLLRGTVVQYAGGGNSLAGISATGGRSRFRIEDTLLQFNQKAALHITFDDTLIDEFSGNRIRDNESIGQIVFELLPSLAGNSDFSGNIDSEIEVPFNAYNNVNFTIPNLGVPLRSNGVQIDDGTLNIDPGVELNMVQDSNIAVDGTFNAVGSPSQPILMHGIDASTDPFWDGVSLTGRGDKTFNHVQIRGAGSTDTASNGAIEIMCSTEAAAKIDIDNTEVSDSQSWGIYISGDGCDIQVGDNVSYFNNDFGNIRLP